MMEAEIRRAFRARVLVRRQRAAEALVVDEFSGDTTCCRSNDRD